MVVDKVGINEEFWKGKSLEEFKEAFKGKLRGDKIKEVYDALPHPPKPKRKPKPKVDKPEIEESKVDDSDK